jgi:hypothetical protein
MSTHTQSTTSTVPAEHQPGAPATADNFIRAETDM